MAKPILFDDSEELHDAQAFQISRKFAKEYEIKKQREELKNARENDENISSGSDEEDEDEDGNLLTPSINVSILKTINALREKEKSIYDSNKFFFNANLIQAPTDKEKIPRKKRFKDVLREQILEEIDEKKKRNEEELGRKEVSSHFAYDEEQKQLRSAFLETCKGDEGKDDDDDMMIVKKNPDRKQDNNDYDYRREFNKFEKTFSSGTLKDPRGEVDDGDKFLLDFLKNKKWIENNDEFINEENKQSVQNIDVNDDDSIDEVDRADDFEARYNFRFEEAANVVNSGADFSMVGYARSGTMNTFRRKDEKRGQKRLERRGRKIAERKAKEEQIRRLKNAKRQEMESKLTAIKKVIGKADEHTLDEDTVMKLMEGDYDPNKFEKIMQEIYNEDFYQKEDNQWTSDADVREALLHDEDGNLIVGEKQEDKGLYDNEQEDVYYDGKEECNDGYDNQEDKEKWDDEAFPPVSSKMEKKLKAKIQEELYKLDYEDIVAGIPTRFKYRQVEPNSYGISTQDILFARDATLKGFVSLKQMAPYQEESEHQVGYKKRKRFQTMLQKDISESAKEEGISELIPSHDDEQDLSVKKKRRRQKKREKTVLESHVEERTVGDSHIEKTSGKEGKTSHEVESSITEAEKVNRKKRRRKKRGNKRSKDVDSLSVTNNSMPEISSLANSLEPTVITTNNKGKNKKIKKLSVKGISGARLEAYGL